MNNQSLSQLIACHECDLLVERVALEPSEHAYCPRCQALLSIGRKNPITKTLVVSFSGLLMIYPAYFLPLMEMRKLGLSSSASVIETIEPMMSGAYWVAASSLLLFAIVFPVMLLLLAFWISLHLKMERYPQYLIPMQRFFQGLIRWGMPEVYVLGILVSLVKLLDDFSVQPGVGLVSLCVMMFCSLLVTTTVSRRYFWEALQHVRQNV